MSRLLSQYFYIRDGLLVTLSEIRNTFMQKVFYPYVIDTGEDWEPT